MTKFCLSFYFYFCCIFDPVCLEKVRLFFGSFGTEIKMTNIVPAFQCYAYWREQTPIQTKNSILCKTNTRFFFASIKMTILKDRTREHLVSVTYALNKQMMREGESTNVIKEKCLHCVGLRAWFLKAFFFMSVLVKIRTNLFGRQKIERRCLWVVWVCRGMRKLRNRKWDKNHYKFKTYLQST